MSFMQKIKKIDWVILAILLVNISLIAYCFSLKTDFHVDEYFTFGHANSTQGAFLVKDVTTLSENLPVKCFKPDDVRDYLTVQQNRRFEYQNVVNNLKVGVHPPLYYFMVHTISSFFPNTFSRWLIFPINIGFFILTFFALYKFAQDIFSDKIKIYLTLILWGFCITTLNMSVFIRSYMMQMFIGTYLLYRHYQLIQKEQINFASLFQIFLFSYLGFLTHYYSLVFIFLLAAITCCYFVCSRQFKNLFKYAAVMLLSVVLFLCSFPAVIDVFLHTSRGIEVQELNLFSYYKYHIALSRLTNFVMTYVFAFRHPYYEFFAFFMIMGASIIILQKGSRNISTRIKVMTAFVILFMFFIYLISPEMFIHDDRYLSPIVPLLCLLVIYYFSLLIHLCNLSNKVINIILAVMVFLNVFYTNWQERSGYFLHITQNTQDVLEKLKGKNVVLLMKYWHGGFSFIVDYPLFSSFCMFDILDKDEMLQQMHEKKYDYLLLYQTEESSTDKLGKATRSDYVEKNLHYDALTFEKTFKKGLYIYDLYKIGSDVKK